MHRLLLLPRAWVSTRTRGLLLGEAGDLPRLEFTVVERDSRATDGTGFRVTSIEPVNKVAYCDAPSNSVPTEWHFSGRIRVRARENTNIVARSVGP
ncbi:hypothetical protein RHA1_ro09041 (plasmid) [Rhodococcus jostii RHA1]|uniref:Uncharacterized protein n=1 Tax=Rhodococcus jostii (strain RHA1) TaxID=101510 RepID=Q0RXA1_RHOJR|nr:hypothetical protein RHA1_ro09041 [Rhodococcus jostii RHA1]